MKVNIWDNLPYNFLMISNLNWLTNLKFNNNKTMMINSNVGYA